jgi:hypothetical protein
MTNLISAMILGMLLWGRPLAKKNPGLHVKVMWVVILADTILVVFLTFARDVFGTILNKMTPLLAIHIALALSTVILYYVAAYWGMKNLKGQRQFLIHMKRLDRAIVPLRILTLVTSLIMQWSHG